MRLKSNIKKILIIFTIFFVLIVSVISKPSYSLTVTGFFVGNANFNIQGQGGIKTTYSNNGYATVLRVGSTDYNVTNGYGEGDSVKCQTVLTPISNNSYIRITYNVTNTSNVNKTISIGTHSDIMINNNDSATVTNLSGDIGFTMSDGGSYTFTFLGKNTYGVTNVDTYWFGQFGQRQANLWNNKTQNVLTNTDSGMAFSWKNRTIRGGETQTYSAVIGVGTLNSPPTLSVTSSTKSSYKSTETIPITGLVNDTDRGDVVTVKYAFDNKTEQSLPGTFTPNGSAKNYSLTITFPSDIQRGDHFLDIWAMDDKGNMSPSVRINFFVETDFSPPTATHTLNPPNWTNQNVTITVKATDSISGVKRIKLPDNSYSNSSTATYIADVNNSYKFVLEDNAGNTADYTVEVNNIERIQPTIDVTPHNTDWMKSASVHMVGSDTGGSEFCKYQYRIDESQSTQGNYGNIIQETEDDITITGEGERYLHIIGYDNAGNVSDETVFGPYKIDFTAPVVKTSGDFITKTTDGVNVNIDTTDALSGVKEVYFDGDKLGGTEHNQVKIYKNGTYEIEAKDNAGNVYKTNIIITNAYYNCEAGLGHPSYSSDYDSCPICDLIQGLEVTKDTEIYDGTEKGVTYVNPQNVKIVEYYDGTTDRPIDVGEYNYELKVVYQNQEYNTGKVGKFYITKKQVQIANIKAVNKIYDGTATVQLNGGELIGIEDRDKGHISFVLPKTGTADSKNVGTHNVSIEPITLQGERAEDYELIQPTPEQVQVEITEKIITIENIKAKTRPYNGTTTVELYGGELVGICEIDNGKVEFVLPKTGTADSKNVGTHNVTIEEITLIGEEAKNYILTQPESEEVQAEITQKEITIEGITATDREYDSTNIVQIQNGKLVGVEEIDSGKVDFILPQTGTIPNKNVGTYNVTIEEIELTGEESGNYKLIHPAEDAVKVNITKKTGIRIEGITATNRKYNGTNIVDIHRGRIVGICEVDNEKVDYVMSETGTTASKDVGIYNVIIPEITLTGEECRNYEITQPSEDEVQVEITEKIITIENIEAKTRPYNGTTTVELYGGELVGICEIDNGKVEFVLPKTGTADSKNVGTHNVTIEEITLIGEEAKNYILTQPESEEVQAEITQKEITIEGITATDREYDSTNIVQIQNGKLVGVEEIDSGKVDFILPQTGTIPNKNVGTYNVTIEEIELTGEESGNYKLIHPAEDAVKVNITKKTGIRIEGITATNRKYNGTNIVDIHRGRIIGICEIDNGKVDYVMAETGTTASKDVGIYNVIIPEITLVGEECGNYEITQPSEDEVQVEITQKEINIVDIVALNREYDGTNIVKLQGGRLIGIEEIDEGKVDFILPETGTIPNKDVGEYFVTIEEILLKGDEAHNYKLIQPAEEDVKVKIVKKGVNPENPDEPSEENVVRVVDITATDRIYNGTNIVEIHRGTLTGVEEGDKDKVDYVMSETGTVPSKDVGKYNVTIPEITLIGEEANNYEITQPSEDEVQVEITQKEINIEDITATNREYDGTNIVEIQGGKLVGLEEVDEGKVEFELSEIGTIPSKDIGEYNVIVPEIKLTKEEAKNYKLIQPVEDAVKVEISKRVITIEGTKGRDRRFNKSDIVGIVGGKLQNVVGNEDVKAVYPRTGTIPSPNTGTYEVTIDNIELEGADIENYELIQPDKSSILVTIFRPEQPNLHIEPYISSLNGKEENLEPIAINASDSKELKKLETESEKDENEEDIEEIIEPKETKEIEVQYKTSQIEDKVRYGDVIQIAIRIYNDGKGAGYAQNIINTIPEGMELKKDSEINTKYGWKATKNNAIQTQILNYDSGTENEIDAVKEEGIDYREIYLELEVTEQQKLNSEVENKTRIEAVDIEGNKRTSEVEGPEIETPISPDNPNPENKGITVKRYIRGNKKLEDLTAQLTIIGDEEKPGKVNLGTTESITVTKGTHEYTARPRGWSTSKEPNADIEVELNGDTTVTQTTVYYMSYIYELEAPFVKPDGTTGTFKQDVYINVDGREVFGNIVISEEDSKVPANLQAEGWSRQKTELSEGETEEPKDVWTTNATNSDNKEDWLDLTKPGTELNPDKEYAPVYYKEVKVSRFVYLNKQIDDIVGTHYRSVRDDTVSTATINLGTTEEVEVHGISAKPRHWSTSEEPDAPAPTGEEKINETSALLNGEVHLTENKTYYMSYNYTIDIPYTQPDGTNGKLEQEVDMAYDGTEKRGEVNVPDGEPEIEEWERDKDKEGDKLWTTDPQNPQDPDKKIDPSDPDTKIDPNIPMYPVYRKQITVTRFVHENVELEKLNAYMYRTVEEDTIRNAEINLGTTTSIQVYGVDATPKYWSTNKEPNVSGPVKNETENETAVELNGIVHLNENKTYYMSYHSLRNIPYAKPDKSITTAPQKVDIAYDGTEKRESLIIPEEDSLVPNNLSNDGWTRDENSTGNDYWTVAPEKGNSESDKIDPSDPNVLLDPNKTLYPIYKKEITINRWIYNNTKMNPFTEYAYRSLDDSTLIRVELNLGTPDNIEIDGKTAKPRHWSTSTDPDSTEPSGNETDNETTVKLDGTVHLTENRDYYMSYIYVDEITYIKPDNSERKADKKTRVAFDGTIKRGPVEIPEEDKIIPQELERTGWIKDKNTKGADNWTTDYENTANPDKKLDPSDPEATINPGETIYPVFKKDITVERYVYPNNTKLEPNLEGTVYRSVGENTIKEVDINLGTTNEIDINGETATPYLWVTDSGLLEKIVDEKEIEGIKPDGIASLKESEQFYMIYKKGDKYEYVDPSGEEKNIDEEAPKVVFEPNGDNTYKKEQGSKVTVTDNKEVREESLKYKWTQGNQKPEEDSFTESFASGTVVTKNNDTGTDWYLWVLAKDKNNNTTIANSNVFYLDNTMPTSTIPGAQVKGSDLVVTFNQTDDDSQINENTKQYAIKETNDSTWKDWVYDTSNIHIFNTLKVGTSYDVKTKVQDNAGNEIESEVATVETEQVSAPSIEISPEEWTNGDVEVSIIYPEYEGFRKEYSYDKEIWNTYNEKIIVKDNNTTIYARNVGPNDEGKELIAERKISNIDKFAPVINEASHSELLEQGNIKLTAKAKDDESGIVAWQYSQNDSLDENSEGWNILDDEATTEEITEEKYVTETGKWYFYVKDYIGNYSKQEIIVEESIYDVIEPQITYEPEGWAQRKTVTIKYSNINTATKQYSINNANNWTQYDQPITITTNDTEVYAKSTLNNKTRQVNKTIEKIDTIAPTINKESFVAEVDPSGGVSLKASAIDYESGIVGYQFSNNPSLTAQSEDWIEIPQTTEQIEERGMAKSSGRYYFYVKDLADNVSKFAIDVDESLFDNIYAKITVTPEPDWTKEVSVTIDFPSVDGMIKSYSTNGGGTFQPYTDTFTLQENTTVVARSEVGSVVRDVKKEISNIDRENPIISSMTNGTEVVPEGYVELSAKAQDTKSGIVAYKFSNKQTDDGNDWISVDKTNNELTLKGQANNTGKWYLFVKDYLGNVSVESTDVEESDFENITPTITFDTEDWTKEVRVTINYPEIEGLQKLHSKNGGSSFENYTESYVMTENETIVAKSVIGNVTKETQKSINKIDRDAPKINSLSHGEELNALIGGVEVTASVIDEGSGLTEYQFSKDNTLTADSPNWRRIDRTSETTTLSGIINTPGTWYLYVKDHLGNYTKQEIEVEDSLFSIIEPTITLEPEIGWTKEVRVTISYPEIGGLEVKYSENGGSDFETYSQPFTVTENKTIIARGILGPITKDVQKVINNIDRQGPRIISVLPGTTFDIASGGVPVTGTAIDMQSRNSWISI